MLYYLFVPLVKQLSQETGIPMVATNDSHYLRKEDARVQEIMVCIQTGKSISDPNRMRMDKPEFYIKSKAEMLQVFGEIPEAIDRTYDISERCNIKLESVTDPFPNFDVPPEHSIDTYFEYVARQELIRILVYAFLFFAILNNLHGKESTQIISLTLIFLGMAISLYAIYQFVTNSDRVWHLISPYKGRGMGTFISPNNLAGFDIQCAQKALADLIRVAHFVAGALLQCEEVEEFRRWAPRGGIPVGGVIGTALRLDHLRAAIGSDCGRPVHATKERAVVENGQVVVRPINYLAQSYDHRIIDGREAVLSLVAIKEALEDPARLLLDI